MLYHALLLIVSAQSGYVPNVGMIKHAPTVALKHDV
jgi:hypothetical protein